jgi:hypothetical protein
VNGKSMPALAALIWMLAVGAGPARAGLVTGDLSDRTPLSAYGGWLVFSARSDASHAWRLMAAHGGVTRELDVPARRVPFDADVGPDRRGRSAVVFSRCTTDPAGSTAASNGSAVFARARGCRIHVLDLATGHERTLHPPGARGASDFAPSMWFGRVAFAQLQHGHRLAQLMVWHRPRGAVERLPAGSVPHDCPVKSCRGRPPHGDIQAIDLDGAGVGFLWRVQAPAVKGAGTGWELRSVRLRDKHRVLGATGYISGACGGALPTSPTMVGAKVWFGLVRYSCQKPTSFISRFGFTGPIFESQPEPQATWALAIDQKNLYELRGPRGDRNSVDRPCRGLRGPCEIVSIPRSGVHLHKTRQHPRPPFF